MLKDMLGNEVQVGDIIAFAVRQGNTARLSTYRILSITEKKTYNWREYVPVKAQQVATGGWKNCTNRASTLNGEGFANKALVIERNVNESESS
jgi:hypothetical protein